METLSQILASFDIFQVILNVFSQIFNPLVHAFQLIFELLFSGAKHIITANPGMVFGTLLFSGMYGIFSIFVNRKKIWLTLTRK